MRIAVYHNQPSGGARRALHGFCEELGRRHELTVYSLTSADREMLDDSALPASVITFPYARRRPIPRGLYLNDWRAARDLRDLERVNRHVASEIDGARPDVVLVDADRYTFAPYVLKFLETPNVYYCHHRPRMLDERTTGPSGTRYERARRLAHRPVEKLLEDRLWRDDFALVRRSTKVVTNSAFNQARITEVYGVDAVVCPPGVDIPTAPASDATNGKSDYVLSVGELQVRKGHDLVVRSLGRLPRETRPPLHVVANGGNHAVRAELERMAAAEDVMLTVRVLPSQADLEAEYRGALMFACGARQEALGMAPLEAMAYALPVVAVAEGGLLETVLDGATGYLVARDPVAFSARIRSLIENPELRVKMGAAALAHIAAVWTWPRRARALEIELESVARTPTP